MVVSQSSFSERADATADAIRVCMGLQAHIKRISDRAIESRFHELVCALSHHVAHLNDEFDHSADSVLKRVG